MRNARWAWVTVMVLALAACGGGGGGDGDSDGSGGGSGSSATSPVAEAGSQQNVKVGAKVSLDGSDSSDADGDSLSYEWRFDSRPSGSSATLKDADSVRPMFTADAAGTYVVALVVGDDRGFSGPDTVAVVATEGGDNSAPVADAGPDQSVTTTSVVELDGSGSRDADRDNSSANTSSLNYDWRFVSRAPGSNATLADASSRKPSFTADATGEYVVELVVDDGQADSDPDRVTIQAAAANSAPVADAGDDRGVQITDTVNLDAADSSDADGDELDYSWQFVSVAQGSGAELMSAGTATPSFVADATGSYVAEVTVTDDNGASSSDRIIITAGPTVALAADLNNDDNFVSVDLPYEAAVSETLILAPDTAFRLGRLQVEAIGGDVTLALSVGGDVSAGPEDEFTAVFDGFQDYADDQTNQTGQFTLPEGETVELGLQINIPANSAASFIYGFDVLETGERFEITYPVESDDN